jgi:hypothetical protein
MIKREHDHCEEGFFVGKCINSQEIGRPFLVLNSCFTCITFKHDQPLGFKCIKIHTSFWYFWITYVFIQRKHWSYVFFELQMH